MSIMDERDGGRAKAVSAPVLMALLLVAGLLAGGGATCWGSPRRRGLVRGRDLRRAALGRPRRRLGAVRRRADGAGARGAGVHPRRARHATGPRGGRRAPPWVGSSRTSGSRSPASSPPRPTWAPRRASGSSPRAWPHARPPRGRVGGAPVRLVGRGRGVGQGVGPRPRDLRGGHARRGRPAGRGARARTQPRRAPASSSCRSRRRTAPGARAAPTRRSRRRCSAAAPRGSWSPPSRSCPPHGSCRPARPDARGGRTRPSTSRSPSAPGRPRGPARWPAAWSTSSPATTGRAELPRRAAGHGDRRRRGAPGSPPSCAPRRPPRSRGGAVVAHPRRAVGDPRRRRRLGVDGLHRAGAAAGWTCSPTPPASGCRSCPTTPGSGLWVFSIDKGGPGQDWRELEPDPAPRRPAVRPHPALRPAPAGRRAARASPAAGPACTTPRWRRTGRPCAATDRTTPTPWCC